jgi:predicted nucleotidyltransferase
VPPETSADLRADKLVQGVIGIFGQVFPDRVRGYYLRGSHASGTSTAGSDIAMFVVFKDAFLERAEAERAREVCGYCSLLSPILLEIIVVSERQLQPELRLAVEATLDQYPPSPDSHDR